MVELPRDSPDRRFVWTPSSGSDMSKASLESGSDSEASKRGRRKIARIQTENATVPECAQRQPSPYAYAQEPSKSHSRHSGEYLLSPEPISSPRTSRKLETLIDHGGPTPRATPNRTEQPSRNVSKGKTSRESSARSSLEDVADNVAVGSIEAKESREKRPSSQYSFTRAELDKKEPKVKFGEGSDCASQTLKFDPSDRPSSIRRATDTTAKPPKVTLETDEAKPSPFQASFTDEIDGAPRKTAGVKQDSLRPSTVKHQGSRNPSPAPSRGAPLTPPGSPSSPMPPKHDNEKPASAPKAAPTQSEKSATYPPTPTDRSKPQSRLIPPVRSDSLPTPLKTDSRLPLSSKSMRPSVALPYPDDDMSLMPRVEDHVYPPTDSLKPPSHQPPRSRSPTLPIDSSEIGKSSKGSSGGRKLGRHHTLAEDISSSKDSTRRPASDNTESSSPISDKPLPPCPRAELSLSYNDWDWYTLDLCPDLDICPDCLESVLLPSKYGKYFKRSPPLRHRKARNCDFGSPWFRLAWLLSTQEKRGDALNYFIALCDVANEEKPCPGDAEASRTWYGVQDENKVHLSGFNACSSCVSNVETLFPSLRSCFSRISQSEPRPPRKCTLRSRNQDLAQYLNALVSIDSRARLEGKADLRPFVSLIRNLNHKPTSKTISKTASECSKDNLLIGQRWYFMPQLPELTVCEECHTLAVVPALRARYPIAEKFHSKMQLVRAEPSLGTSCQLYSPRMREIWRRTVERDDWGALARFVRDRKTTEMQLQAKHKSLRQQADDVKRWSQGTQQKEELHRLHTELEKIAEEWRRWE
ncbi:MAG: hypothetical protein M1820_001446 [Bogoriella megaspora]|nr:MAG: hypothetical protein M1820_001446 [Bogoriella megaspora]